MTKFAFVTMVLLVFTSFSGAGELTLKMEKDVVIGDGKLVLDSIHSICEDEKENFYTLDFKACKIHKFSPRGELLLSFGQNGEGPGDLKHPQSIHYSAGGTLVVGEMINIASIFDAKGNFLRRYNFSQRLGLVGGVQYGAQDLFHVQKRDAEGTSRQLLINSKGDIVNGKLFSYQNKPLKIGGIVFGFQSFDYTPIKLYYSYKESSIAAITNQYKILTINNKGEITGEIIRDIPPPAFSSREKEFLKNEVLNMKTWPPEFKKKQASIIPGIKNYFHSIFLTQTHVLVFRVKEDLTKKDSPIPVDVFNLEGKFLGTVTMMTEPRFISDRYMYVTETNEADDLLLVKYRYSLGK